MGLVSSLNHTRLIGSEFEAFCVLTGGADARNAQQALADCLTANGIRAIARGYDHSPLPSGVAVAVEYDSSIVPEQRYAGVRHAQIECKTRPLTLDEWEAIVPKMLDIMKYFGCRTNTSTGHHVTLSFDEMTENPSHVRSLWNLHHRHQNVLFGLVAPSRRNNSYCRPLPNATKVLHGANSLRELRRRLSQYDRYCYLNTTHLLNGESPRIEIRSHHGTLDADKARAWRDLQMATLDHAIRRSCQAAPASVPNDRKAFDSLITTIGMKPRSGIYSGVDPALRASAKSLLKTWKKFNGNQPQNAQRKAEQADLDDGDRAVREEAA